MKTFTLLGAAGLAATLIGGAPAFAQSNNNANNNLNNPSSYSNGRSFGHNPNAANGNSNPGFTSNTTNVVGNGKYANVGSGGYAANQDYIHNNNNGNNASNNNNSNNNWRISQRNPVLADNGDARASKVIGTDVYNSNDQQVGSVDDILIGSNGVFAVIATNNKKVAVPFNKLKFGNAVNQGNDKIVLPKETQAHLNTQPVFHYNVTDYQGSKANVANNNGNGGAFVNNNGNGHGNGWNGNGGGPFSSNGHNGNNANNNGNNGNKG